jgi:hypothetical protein
MGSGIVPSPSEVMTKATRMLKRIMLLQMVWFLCFVAGGAMVLRTAWENNHLPARCTAGSLPQRAGVIASCAHHSYLLAVPLVLIGIAGLFLTGYVATRLAVRYLGEGAAAFLRGGRRFMGPMGPRTAGPNMGGGFAPSGSPSGYDISLPAGTPRVPPKHPPDEDGQG